MRALCVAEKPSMAKSLANLLVDGPPQQLVHKVRPVFKEIRGMYR